MSSAREADREQYLASKEVERISRELLDPWLHSLAEDGKVTLHESKKAQETLGDIQMLRNGKVCNIELKAERDWTNNLFIEEWSNRKRGAVGWLYKLETDYMFYHFLDVGIVVQFDFRQLRHWLLEMPPDWCNYETRNTNLVQLTEKPQGNRAQLNDTWGRILPVKDLYATKHVWSKNEVDKRWRY